MPEIESIESLQNQVELAKAMKRLQENEDFKRVFDEKYIKDWAVTQTYNISIYNQQSRIGVVENMVARSIFSQFCDQLIDDGNIAIDTLQQIEKEESTVE